MLLHVIESALPVDHALHLAGRERSIEHVQHRALELLHVDDRGARERAAICRLPTPFGIERGAIQHRRRPPLDIGQRHKASVEASQV